MRHSHTVGVRESSNEGHWAPNTDVFLTDDKMVIKVELAGMRREDLELTVVGNQLRIAGHRVDECRQGKCRFIVMEVNYGPFETILDLPAGYDLSTARAAYQNGFLRIDVDERSSGTSKSVSIDIEPE